MLQRGLQRLKMVAEGLVGLVDGLQLHLAAVLMQVLAEDQRMVALLLRLDLVPMGETLQALFRIIISERQVQVRRIQLLADLIVDQLVHLCIHSILLQDTRPNPPPGFPYRFILPQTPRGRSTRRPDSPKQPLQDVPKSIQRFSRNPKCRDPKPPRKSPPNAGRPPPGDWATAWGREGGGSGGRRSKGRGPPRAPAPNGDGARAGRAPRSPRQARGRTPRPAGG